MSLLACPSYNLQSTNHRRFDSSVGRGDFRTQIGVGAVIKGMLFLAWMVLIAAFAEYHRLGRGSSIHEPGGEIRLDDLKVRN